MNLLAHLLLADRSDTSFAGQILGDEIKGRLDRRFAPPIRHGIRLHRAIDAASDAHIEHRALRRRFDPPLRRYAGIIVDIGLDHALARHWAATHDEPLADFARRAQHRVMAEWPDRAPFAAQRLAGLAELLAGYRHRRGIQRALNSVSARLRRTNPVADAGPALAALDDAFDQALAPVLSDLHRRVHEIDRAAQTGADQG